jgi:2-C-methyl-D-erythritol 4-phosphate cytidylyltransferase
MAALRNRMSRTGAVIVGAGNSRRMGGDKVFMSLGGKPLLAWSVDACQKCQLIDQIVIVLNETKLDLGRRLAKERSWTKVADICAGGQRRQDSVRQGLNELEDCDWIMIHDGARPFLTDDLIRDGLEAAQATGAAVAAVPIKDTVKVGGSDMMVRKTLNREELWAAQTPQIFRFDIIAEAHEQVKEDVTDDAIMVEHLGHEVRLYMGSYNNIKITTPEDMALAELIAGKK